jgi:putative ABC transport system substrate-binding protein
LEFLREVLTNATTVAVLMNPNSPDAQGEPEQVQDAAKGAGQRLIILDVSSEQDIAKAFATFVQSGAGALLVGTGAFLTSNRNRVVALEKAHSLPAMHPQREAVVDGGLMSYGTSNIDAFRQAGIYAGRILSGEKPADLPILAPTRYELVINLKTAKALGLTIPPSLLARADEVIE